MEERPSHSGNKKDYVGFMIISCDMFFKQRLNNWFALFLAIYFIFAIIYYVVNLMHKHTWWVWVVTVDISWIKPSLIQRSSSLQTRSSRTSSRWPGKRSCVLIQWWQISNLVVLVHCVSELYNITVIFPSLQLINICKKTVISVQNKFET